MAAQFHKIKVESSDPVINIQRKLQGLGIGFRQVGPANPGPIVTGIPITLDASTPISKLLNKDEDLALACGVESVTIQREGKQIIVYVPNEERKTVDFKDALYWYLQDGATRNMQIPILDRKSTRLNSSHTDI